MAEAFGRPKSTPGRSRPASSHPAVGHRAASCVSMSGSPSRRPSRACRQSRPSRAPPDCQKENFLECSGLRIRQLLEARSVTRTARCSCGQLLIECHGEPTKVSICHCLECQRRTGSAFGIAAFFEIDDTKVVGQSQAFTRQGDSGFPVTLHFCGTCGSTVFWYPARKPSVVAVAPGSFADPAFPAPSQSVYEQHRHPWVELRLGPKA